MMQVDVNWWAVLAGGVASMILGYVWYSMPVFGKTWAREIGKSADDLKKSANGGMYFLMFLSALVLSYIMIHFVVYAGAKDAMGGATTGFWAWLGFAATTGVSKKIFQGTSWTLFMIDYGYHLVQFLVVGALVASMLK